LVLFEDPGDPVEVRAELGPGPGSGGTIGRRLGVGEDLLQRPPVHPGLAEDLALADAFDQDPAADVSPQLHVSEHLWASGIGGGRGDPTAPRSPSLPQRPRWGPAFPEPPPPAALLQCRPHGSFNTEATWSKASDKPSIGSSCTSRQQLGSVCG